MIFSRPSENKSSCTPPVLMYSVLDKFTSYQQLLYPFRSCISCRHCPTPLRFDHPWNWQCTEINGLERYSYFSNFSSISSGLVSGVSWTMWVIDSHWKILISVLFLTKQFLYSAFTDHIQFVLAFDRSNASCSLAICLLSHAYFKSTNWTFTSWLKANLSSISCVIQKSDLQ